MVPGGLPEGRVCKDSLGDGSWTASTSALVSAKVRRKPGVGRKSRAVRNKGVAHTARPPSLRTRRKPWGCRKAIWGHSSGHTGTLAPRHKNCMYSRGRLHRGRKDATYHKTAAPGDPEAIGPSNPTLSLIPTSPLPQYTVLEGEWEPGRLVTSMPPAATHSWGVVKASLTCEPLRANWGRLGWGSLPTPILFLEQEHSANVRSLLIQIRLPHTSLPGTNRADSQVKQ